MKKNLSLLELFLYFYIFSLTFFNELKLKVYVGGLLLPYNIFLTLIITFFIFFIFFITKKKTGINSSAANHVFVLFCMILLYSIFTIMKDDKLVLNTFKITPVILTFFAIVVPFLFSKFLSRDRIIQKRNLFIFSLIITTTTLIYAVYSFIINNDFTRLSTPLGGAAVNHVAILLTLSVYIGNIKTNYFRSLSLVLLVTTISLLILTGSRVGLVTMVLFLFLILLDIKRPAKTLGLLLSLVLTFFALLNILPTDRYDNFESNAREESFETSLKIVKQSTTNLLFGAGYGQIWPWYAYENDFSNSSELILTPYGHVLTNPHSVYIGILTELGLLGLIPLVLIIVILIKNNLRAIRNDDVFLITITWGILCTLPAFAFDLYLFKNYEIAVIWWYFVFYSLVVSSIPKRQGNKTTVNNMFSSDNRYSYF